MAKKECVSGCRRGFETASAEVAPGVMRLLPFSRRPVPARTKGRWNMSQNHEAARVVYCRPIDGCPLVVERETPANDVEMLQLEARGFTECTSDSVSAGLPFGLSYAIRPCDGSPEAISAWVDLMCKALTLLEEDQLAGNEALNSTDILGNKQNATDIMRDAFLFVDELRKRGWTNAPCEPPDEFISFRSARIKMMELREWMRSAEAVEFKTVIAMGNGCYRISDSRVFRVSEDEDAVLSAFLEFPAMEEKELNTNSGVGRARDVLCDLKRKYGGAFASAIHLPGGKGKGGYHVSIRGDAKPSA